MVRVAPVAGGQAQVVAEEGTVVGVGNGHEGLGLFHGAFVAQVGHAILRDDGVDVVLRVVHVRAEGNDAAHASVLGRGAAGEDAQHRVVRKVGAAAHAVHHHRAAHLRRVDVAVDVGLDGRVERADAQPRDDFGAVGNLRRAQQQAAAIFVDVLVELLQVVGADGERARRCRGHAPLAHEAQGLLLQHLGVDVEVGHVGAAPQGAQHGVGPRAHSALQGERAAVHISVRDVPHEEVGHVAPNLVGHLGGRRHGPPLVGHVAHDETAHVRRLHLDIGQADVLNGMRDAHGRAQPGVFDFVNVVHADDLRAVPRVQLHEYAFLGHTTNCRGDTDARREVDAQLSAHVLHVDGLDDAPVEAAGDALAQVRGVVAQVEVGVAHTARVVGVAHLLVHRKGQAAVHGVGRGQLAVAAGADGGSRDDVHLEGTARGMLGAGPLRQRGRYALGGAGRAETAHTYHVAVVNERGRLAGGHLRNDHRLLKIVLRPQIYKIPAIYTSIIQPCAAKRDINAIVIHIFTKNSAPPAVAGGALTGRSAGGGEGLRAALRNRTVRASACRGSPSLRRIS